MRRHLARDRGHITEDDLAAVKRAGYTDAQVTGINPPCRPEHLDQYFNGVFKTDIDVPVVEARKAA